MISPAGSTVTGKVLTARTRVAYAGDWALFTDWCAATGHAALPSNAATIDAFNAACPAAATTQRRRLVAIEHYHRIQGDPPPTEPRNRSESVLRREPIDPDQVDLAMRMLPSHGWTAGFFGRRDRALLTLAAQTTLPYRQMARMTIGQIQVSDGTASVIDNGGHITRITQTEDPVLCGPCALARWQRVVDVDARPDQRADLRHLLGHANTVSSVSRHRCYQPEPVHPDCAAVPLFPPINQWGHFPMPVRAMSRHAAAALCRQAETGLTGHRSLRVDALIHVVITDPPNAAAEPAPPPVWDWAAANERKKAVSSTD